MAADLTPIAVTLHAGQEISLLDLFTDSDPNGLPILSYQVNDSGQNLTLNGATNQYLSQQFQGYYGITAADMAKVTYVAGAPGSGASWKPVVLAEGEFVFGCACFGSVAAAGGVAVGL